MSSRSPEDTISTRWLACVSRPPASARAFSFAAAVLLSVGLVGCGQTNDNSPPPADAGAPHPAGSEAGSESFDAAITPHGADASDAEIVDADMAMVDGGPCVVVASDVDRSCAADTDCSLVPPGGDYCHSCSATNLPGDLNCDLTAVSASSAAAYLAALKIAEGAYLSSTNGCFGGCPTQNFIPHCASGVCEAVLPPDGGASDAGDGGRGTGDSGADSGRDAGN